MIARPAFLFPEDESDLHFHRDERFIGTILSFATSLSMAYTFVLMRRLQKTPITTVITYFSFFCLCSGGITSVVLKQVNGYTLYSMCQKESESIPEGEGEERRGESADQGMRMQVQGCKRM